MAAFVKKSGVEGTADFGNTVAAVAAFLEEPLAVAVTTARQNQGLRGGTRFPARHRRECEIYLLALQRTKPSQSRDNNRDSGLVARISGQMPRNILLQIVGKKSSDFVRHVSAQFG